MRMIANLLRNPHGNRPEEETDEQDDTTNTNKDVAANDTKAA